MDWRTSGNQSLKHKGNVMLAGALGIKFLEEERGPGWGWTWGRHSGNLEEG